VAWYYVVLLVVLVLALAVVGLRVRKLRRDARRRQLAATPRNLIRPPASPYERATGFRLLGEGLPRPSARQSPSARIERDADQPFVFSDLTMPGTDDVVPIEGRHDTRWALDRAVNAPASGWRWVVVVVGVVAVVLVLVAVTAQSH
jgi:uncharacterized integral membrane protein